MSNEQEIPATPVDAELVTETEIDVTTVTEDAAGNDETVATVVDPELLESEPTFDELKKELAQAQQQAQDNWDKALRIQAEMENLKRRTQKDLEDAHKFALTGFAKELLPVLDSLELGLQAATGDNDEVKKFREGSELTIKQFEAAFAKFNVVTINPVGEPFNAEHHQAMVMQAVEGAAPNTVVTVFQKGYLLNGRLLRPAMVVVAKAAD
ncbi:MAG: nucleotide exchange factor GrpE [Methylovulum miyakonense]|uniref:nucleotide exchange factor GrpE n=1 Tax=Methylovulum miyakonense TaxID=645578 RepID=UPI003BB6B8D4